MEWLRDEAARPVKTRCEPFEVDMPWVILPDALSDVPESETWREGIVTERNLETGVITCADGHKMSFVAAQLLRNMTHWENTQVGATVWITERGGISAHPPNTLSQRQRYDVMMKEQVRLMADKIR